MTMVPAPKLSKPHLLFYGGCGADAPAPASDVMTRFADGCSAAAGYGGYNNSNINGNTTASTTATTAVTPNNNNNIISNTRVTTSADSNGANNINNLDSSNLNCVLGSDLGIGHPNNTSYSYHNIFLMAEEQQSITSNTSVNDDGDEQQPAATTAAISSTSIKGRDDTPTPPPPPDHHHHHHHHQRGRSIIDSSSSWLQLGLGRTQASNPSSPFEQHHPAQGESTAQMIHMGGGGAGLMLELNLGGGGDGSSGIIHHTPPLLPGLDSRVPQRPLDFTSSNLFAGGGVGSATTFLSPHHPIIPLIPSFQHPQPHHHPHPHPQQLLLLSDHHQHQIGWGYVNQRTALSAAAGCSSSMSPSSSSSMPQAMPGQGAAASLLTSPFTPAGSSVDAVDSEFRFIHPPPRRPHSGIWFALQASLHQSKEPFLPQLSKRFLRIKDGRMTVRLVMKYVANKLGLDSESEVEIRCRGQQVVPFLTLQHVRDNIWSQRDAAVTLLPDASTSDHVMVLNYGRSSSSNNITISSTYT